MEHFGESADGAGEVRVAGVAETGSDWAVAMATEVMALGDGKTGEVGG